jgi:non-homologous end joining protein Ku
MRSMWKGSISFGLVTIPVQLYPGTSREELSFKQLRKSDLSPINYKRVHLGTLRSVRTIKKCSDKFTRCELLRI